MNDRRLGGIALISGSVGMILTMAMHPSGAELFAEGGFDSAALRFVVAHSLAVASLFVLLLGTIALSRVGMSPSQAGGAALGSLGVSGLAAFALATVMGTLAATFSGFLGPVLAREELQSEGAGRDLWRAVFEYNGMLNQVFAVLFVLASSLAIVLWSIQGLRGRRLPRGLGVFGVVVGPVLALTVGSGHLHLDVHGFGLVALCQAVWFTWAGVCLCRRGDE